MHDTAPGGSRECRACGEEKCAAAFPLRKGKPNYHKCKACHAESERQRRKARPVPLRRRKCADCDRSLNDRGPQAQVCTACAGSRRRNRQQAPALPTRRDVAPVLPLIRQGASAEEACRTAGIPWVTVHRRRGSDREFARQFDEAVRAGADLRLRPCGTPAKYDRGCRCDGCTRAHLTYGRDASRNHRRDWRVQAKSASDKIPHGITGRLNYACKCDICMTAARERQGRWQRKANAESLERATRHHAQWTGPEMELAARRDLSATGVAAITGRTMWAVRTMRSRLNREPSLQWLAGQRTRLH